MMNEMMSMAGTLKKNGWRLKADGKEGQVWYVQMYGQLKEGLTRLTYTLYVFKKADGTFGRAEVLHHKGEPIENGGRFQRRVKVGEWRRVKGLLGGLDKAVSKHTDARYGIIPPLDFSERKKGR